MIALIDYQIGNLKSVMNAFEKIGKEVKLIKNPEDLQKHDKAILPGVGAFSDAMKFLKQSGMNEAIFQFAKSGKPFLGICLGMQLLFDKSEEFGETKGLELIEGEVVLFDKTKFNKPLNIPHMGWNNINIKKKNRLMNNINDKTYLYFVHSLHAKTDDKYIVATTNYGYDFASVVQKDNIFGFQAHPEKSHEEGLKILKNFVEII